jgi:hypothetical protein
MNIMLKRLNVGFCAMIFVFSLQAFCGDYLDRNLTMSNFTTLKSEIPPITYTVGYCDWNYTGNEQVWEGKRYRELTLRSDQYQTDLYVTVDSWLNGGENSDPMLYYEATDGSYQYLSDDEKGNRQFKAVIHFNKCTYSKVYLSLKFLHYLSTDNGHYRVGVSSSVPDPGYKGVYYLEVYSDGSLQRVWHP